MSDNRNYSLVLIGVNHKTAEVEIREKLAMANSNPPALEVLSNLPHCKEVLFLSTCNRVEVLTTTDNPEAIKKAIKELWKKKGNLDDQILDKCLYIHEGEEAIRHLFRVASSLDSMVVGEPQILGQLKDAYRKASDAKTLGVVLNKLCHKAFSVAKKIRTETKIASHAVSISYAAVELAKKIFGELHGKRAMLIGAGEMAELAAQHLMANGIKKLIVANRTLSRAVDLAKSLGGTAISLEEIFDSLIDVDIVISSTGAPGIIIEKKDVARIMRPRRHQLLFFIDIAVPRDIDPAVNDIDNVYLFDIDDLKGVVELNKAEREKEALKAERMVEAEVIKFLSWMETLDVIPVIKKLQEKAEAVRQKELARSQKVLKDLTPKQKKAVEILTSSIVQKVLHDPIIYLRKESSNGSEDIHTILDITTRLFNLNGFDNNHMPIDNQNNQIHQGKNSCNNKKLKTK